MRALAFLVAAALFVLGPFQHAFVDAERYGHHADIMPSDWKATNVWLEAAACALERGAWLALCEDGALVPGVAPVKTLDDGAAWNAVLAERSASPRVAVVGAGYGAGSHLAILGPSRMDYVTGISTVQAIARYVSRYLE